MPISYVLSREEFRAYWMMNAPRSFRREWLGSALVVTTCATTFGLISLAGTNFAGYLFGAPTTLALISGLTLFGACLPFISRVFERRDLRQQADAHYHLFSHSNTLTFDENGWQTECQHGVHRQPWSALHCIKEVDQSLVMFTRVQAFIFPKRAFTEEEFLSLRRHAEQALQGTSQETLLTIPQRLSAADNIWTTILHRWRKPSTRAGLIIGYLAGVTISGRILLNGFRPGGVLDSFSIAFALVLFFLMVGIEPAAGLFQFLEHGPHLPYHLRVSQEGILVDQGIKLGLVFFEFDRLQVIESRSVFMLYFAPEQWLIVAKRNLTSEQIARLRHVLAEKAKRT